MKRTTGVLATSLTAALVLAAASSRTPFRTSAAAAAPAPEADAVTDAVFPVSGTATHYFSQAIIHSRENTAKGITQRSTDFIRLIGDLEGYILYHPISRIDPATNTLVNTGTQIFSGTVAGSAPVILHDSRFRFQVDLSTGATHGEVFLGRSGDAPAGSGWFDCRLTITGTGVTAEGDNVSAYAGECTARGNAK